jgi:hypothetical protein
MKDEKIRSKKTGARIKNSCSPFPASGKGARGLGQP